MNKKILLQELSDALSRRMNLSKKDAELFVRSVFEVVEEYLQADKLVKIKGFGTFKLVAVESRESVDVNTGERIVINGYTKVSFTPDTALRDEINKPFAQFDTVILYEGTNIADMERMDYPEIGEEEQNISEEKEEGDSRQFEDEGKDEAEDVQAEEDTQETAMPEQQLGNALSDIRKSLDDLKKMDETVAEDEQTPGEHEEQAFDEQPVPSADEVLTPPANEVLTPPADDEAQVQQINQVRVEYQRVGSQKVQEQQVGSLRTKEQTVRGQRVDVQKIEHQTVENQHIVQLPPKDSGRREGPAWWTVVAMILMVLLLMLGSYLLGYYRMLSPIGGNTNDSPLHISIEKIVPKELLEDETPAKLNADIPEKRKDTLEKHTPSVATSKAEQQPAKPKVIEKPAQTLTKKNNYPQVKNGAYEIIGTRKMHRLKNGETLRGIARKEYGSKNFVDYIVVYNQITNPDIIPEGDMLKLPELRLKP